MSPLAPCGNPLSAHTFRRSDLYPPHRSVCSRLHSLPRLSWFPPPVGCLLLLWKGGRRGARRHVLHRSITGVDGSTAAAAGDEVTPNVRRFAAWHHAGASAGEVEQVRPRLTGNRATRSTTRSGPDGKTFWLFIEYRRNGRGTTP